MNIITLSLQDIKPYENNPRIIDDNAVEKVAASIKEFGFKVPIIIDKDNVIVAGHTRLNAAERLKLKAVPCIIADDLTEEQIKAYRIADNKTAEFAEWDNDLLSFEFEELRAMDFDLCLTGFDDWEIEELKNDGGDDLGVVLDENRETLRDKFIIPPFSVLDTRQGYWQDRKSIWKGIIKSDVGRDEGLLGSGLKELAEKHGSTLTGTSIFDPVLCETLINWFCPKDGKILDPFAGGSVRGLVSVLLGRDYTGIDLSGKQINANIDNYNAIAGRMDLNGNELKTPVWINDDSANIDLIVSGKYDFALTCPPYADLEVYSDDPRDLSNMDYAEFKETCTDIIKKTADKLNDNSFFAIVVGEVRDKKGYYYNFVGDTIEACKAAGLKYYNERILIECGGTAALRVGRQFTARRKVVKTHQNVLIFVKGDETKVVDRLAYLDYEIEG